MSASFKARTRAAAPSGAPVPQPAPPFDEFFLDKALRIAIQRFYPALTDIELTDYKVRVLDEKKGRAIIAVRTRLRELFLADIDKIERPLIATGSNEYEVAKTVVDLLWKK